MIRSPARASPSMISVVPRRRTPGTRWPSTKVPRALLVSTSSHVEPVWRSSAWWRDTVGLVQMMSASSARPMTVSTPGVR